MKTDCSSKSENVTFPTMFGACICEHGNPKKDVGMVMSHVSVKDVWEAVLESCGPFLDCPSMGEACK